MLTDADVLMEKCQAAEFFETDSWAVEAILKSELLTPIVVDAGAGRGVLSEAVERAGYSALQIDLNDWRKDGFSTYESRLGTFYGDFLDGQTVRLALAKLPAGDFTVITNPPFSKSCKFVDQCFEVGARKVVCFQRFAWWEGSFDSGTKRGRWWEKRRPNRIYICGDRATCWRGDIADAKREDNQGGGPTAYAWFVWERGQPAGPLLSHIYKTSDGHGTPLLPGLESV